jgi:hypothetical protein
VHSHAILCKPIRQCRCANQVIICVKGASDARFAAWLIDRYNIFSSSNIIVWIGSPSNGTSKRRFIRTLLFA